MNDVINYSPLNSLILFSFGKFYLLNLLTSIYQLTQEYISIQLSNILLELASAEKMISWESEVLYPLCHSYLLSAYQNKNPDPTTKTKIFAALQSLGMFFIQEIPWIRI